MTTVLVVDDNAMNRKLARDILDAAGIGTFEAATGAHAITVARDRLPDVILMDIRIPDMDGVEATQHLKARDSTAGIPVVAMSATPLEDRSKWLEANGFAGCIEKPIDIATFVDQVRRYCPATSGGYGDPPPV